MNNNPYDLDDEEIYGELEEFVDQVTGERYTINPITSVKNYIEDEE